MDFRKGFKSTNKMGGIGFYNWVVSDGIGFHNWMVLDDIGQLGGIGFSQLLQTVEETVSQAKYSTFGRQRESLVYKALSKIHPVNHKSSAYVAS